MTYNKTLSIEDRFKNAGVKVTPLINTSEIKRNSWVMPTNDRRGMIRLTAAGSSPIDLKKFHK